MRLTISTAAAAGRRGPNQDWVGGFVPLAPEMLAARGCCYVVADGIGGAQAGAVASRLTGQTILATYFRAQSRHPVEDMRQGLIAANLAVYRAGQRLPAYSGMGAAVVAAAIVDYVALIGHMGDCRAYIVRAGRCYRATRDHSLTQYLVDKGALSPAQAASHPYRNVLSRYAGMGEGAEPQVAQVRLEPGDCVVLCSDGAHKFVSAEDMIKVVQRREHARPASALVGCALRRRTDDDCAVAVVQVEVGAPVASQAGARAPVARGQLRPGRPALRTAPGLP